MIQDNYYTHALWHVKEGMTDAFVGAWKNFGEALSKMPGSPALQGTLIQSVTDPLVFYSFGPWETLEDIHAIRNDENMKNAMAAIIATCEKAAPGTYRKYLKLEFPGSR
jgi:heme-degrading monooxygenase HmoA